MASVRLTKELRGKILAASKHAFDLAKPKPELPAELGSEILDAALASEAYQLILRVQALADEVRQLAGHKPRFFGLDDIGCEVNAVCSLNTRFRCGGNFETLGVTLDPPREVLTVHRRYTPRVVEVDCELLPLEDRDRITTALCEYITACRQRESDREAYSNQINNLLGSCNSLKQLLEAWPQVRVFVPDWAMNEHNAPAASRGRGSKGKVEFDAAAVTAVAAKAKLTGKL